MMLNPPMTSLVSMNGPSVTTGVPPALDTTVAVSGPCRPPPKTHSPRAASASWTAVTSRSIVASCSGSGWVEPAG